MSEREEPHGVRLQIRGVGKAFGDHRVLEGVELDIEPGELVAVVGRSGCGKTTLLRLIADLESPSEGELHLLGGGAHRAGEVRMVFQDARLLPWKSVTDNVALGLPRGAAAPATVVAEALAKVGLGTRGGDWPGVLSGGQRQRVALARALVSRPRLLLLDEPLGALDAFTRVEMQRLIEQIWAEARFTAVLVTHDVEEAVALADRVIALEEGRVALEVPVPLPRPRQRHTGAFVQLVARVLGHLNGTAAADGSTIASTAEVVAPVAGESPAVLLSN
jgi:sulfonate transport system ATP-binding protein